MLVRPHAMSRSTVVVSLVNTARVLYVRIVSLDAIRLLRVAVRVSSVLLENMAHSLVLLRAMTVRWALTLVHRARPLAHSARQARMMIQPPVRNA